MNKNYVVSGKVRYKSHTPPNEILECDICGCEIYKPHINIHIATPNICDDCAAKVKNMTEREKKVLDI